MKRLISKKKQAVVLTSLILCSVFAFSYFKNPSYQKIKSSVIGSDQVLLDRNGQYLQVTRTNFKKRRVSWLPLKSYSKELTQLIVAVEDKRFFSHFGIDPIALTRAMKSYFIDKNLEGGSTITMQLADLISNDVLLKNKKIKKGFILSKINQIYRAFFIDLKWNKEEILEAYLNLIHLRGEHQGVSSFTQAYLSKTPHYLSFEESVAIASTIKRPNAKYERLFQRTCYNTTKLSKNKDYDCTKLKPIITKITTNKPYIENDYKLAPHLARKLFKENKKSITTSYLDAGLQKTVYGILKKNLSYLQNNKVSDISAIVIDNKTGEVLSYVGTVEEFSKSKDVDGADSPRQAGSTLKPFLYARALEKKLVTTASIISDEPTVLPWSGGLYRPTNYDSKFHGNVTLRQALASSLNVPAVKIVKILGLAETYETIKSLKFSDLNNPDFYGASIALGAAEVRLHELANTYRAIANDGILSPLKWSVEQTHDKTKNFRIMTPQTAFLLKSILSDGNARGIGFGWNSALETSFWAAAKTGTSKALRDNWCIGFSSDYTVGVWAGNFSSKSMVGVSGVSGAAPSWYEIMNHLHSKQRSHPPIKPAGIVEKKIKFDWRVGELTEFFIKGTEPTNSIISLPKKYDISITFPAKGSTLAINPHKGEQSKAIFLRYKGKAPENSSIYLNEKRVGTLTNPFKINNIYRGKFRISIKDRENKLLDRTHFEIK